MPKEARKASVASASWVRVSGFEIQPYLQGHELSCSYFMVPKKTRDSWVRLSAANGTRVVVVSLPLFATSWRGAT